MSHENSDAIHVEDLEEVAAVDELKVYQNEGAEEKVFSETLAAEKLSLVTESEGRRSTDKGGETQKKDDAAPSNANSESSPERVVYVPYPVLSPYSYNPYAAQLQNVTYQTGCDISLPTPTPMGLPFGYIHEGAKVPSVYPFSPSRASFMNPLYPYALGSSPVAHVNSPMPMPSLALSALQYCSPGGMLEPRVPQPQHPSDITKHTVESRVPQCDQSALDMLQPRILLDHSLVAQDMLRPTVPKPQPQQPSAGVQHMPQSRAPQFDHSIADQCMLQPRLQQPSYSARAQHVSQPRVPQYDHSAESQCMAQPTGVPPTHPLTETHEKVTGNNLPLTENEHSVKPGNYCEQTRQVEKTNTPYVKKPLNAFMIFLKEHRKNIKEENSDKSAAAINQLLAEKWKVLDLAEKMKYREMASKEKQLHQQLNPGWSTAMNYNTKKGKTYLDCIPCPGNMQGSHDVSCCKAKKACRSLYGINGQNRWCQQCLWKKKCSRVLRFEKTKVV